MPISHHIISKNSTRVPGLIVICGSTATGKSGLAIALAKRLHSVIISADSRQVYREFNIGTAKPSLAEQQEVPHYLIDICDPTQVVTLAEYQQRVWEVLGERGEEGGGRGERGEGGDAETRGCGDTETRGCGDMGTRGHGDTERHPTPHTPHPLPPTHNSKLKTQNSKLSPTPHTPHPTPHTPHPLLVGGTGLYIKSIVRGMQIPRVSPQMELRSQLQALGQKQCYAMLQQVDPVAATRIHPNDGVRTLRSLEVFYTTGIPISQQQGENPPIYPILQIGLECRDTTTLQKRIEQRTEQMVAAGLVAEVDYLMQKYGVDLPLLKTLGYAEFVQYCIGNISLDEAKKLTVLHTRQFAKRQRTWFRSDPTIEWFDADAPDLVAQVEARIHKVVPLIV